jgi:hypothetical protein
VGTVTVIPVTSKPCTQRLRAHLAHYIAGRWSLLELTAWIVLEELAAHRAQVPLDEAWCELTALLRFLLLGLEPGQRDEHAIRAMLGARLALSAERYASEAAAS